MADVFAGQHDPVALEAAMQVTRELGQGMLIGQGGVAFQGSQGGKTIQSTGIKIMKAKSVGNAVGDGSLARGSGTVNSDDGEV